MEWAWQQDLAPMHRLTLLAIAWHVNANGTAAYPSVKTLAKEAQLSERTVAASLKELVTRGLIKITQRTLPGTKQLTTSLYSLPDFTAIRNQLRTTRHDSEMVQDVHQGGAFGENYPVQDVHQGGAPDAERTRIDKQGDVNPGSEQIHVVASPPVRIFGHYKTKIQPGARVGAAEKIKARLRTFSEAELFQAIDNFSTDVWQVEHNASRGAPWFFHSDGRIEQYLAMTPRTSQETRKGEPSGTGNTAASANGRISDLDKWG